LGKTAAHAAILRNLVDIILPAIIPSTRIFITQGRNMQYDPIKDRLAIVVKRFPFARALLETGMDIFLLRQRYVKQTIHKYFRKDLHMAYYDAGAGFCQYSHHIMRHFPNSKVHAVDLKADYLASYYNSLSSVQKNRFSFSEGDLQSYEPLAKYDLVTAIDIMEHIPDDVSTLKHFHNCMKDRGILIISTPSDLDEAARFTEEHVRPGYAKTELEYKVSEAGFNILESKYSYGRWGALAWRWMIRNPLNWFNRSHRAIVFILPYLLAIMPLGLLLMQMDLLMDNKKGTGLLLVARKDHNKTKVT